MSNHDYEPKWRPTAIRVASFSLQGIRATPDTLNGMSLHVNTTSQHVDALEIRALAFRNQESNIRNFEHYPKNWDGEGAPAPRLDAVNGALRLLRELYVDGHNPYHSLPSITGGVIVYTTLDGVIFRFVVSNGTTIMQLDTHDQLSDKHQCYDVAVPLVKAHAVARQAASFMKQLLAAGN